MTTPDTHLPADPGAELLARLTRRRAMLAGGPAALAVSTLTLPTFGQEGSPSGAPTGLPAGSGAGVYELRMYQIAPGQMPLMQDIFRDLVTPLMPEFGITGVGYWATPDDAALHWIVRHESLDLIGPNWDRFHADPRWTEGLPTFERGRTVVTGTASLPLVGVPGLPPSRDAANRQAALDYVDRLLNGQDLTAPDEYLALDLIQHNPTVADGLEAERAFARDFLAANPGLSVEVRRAFAVDDHVVTHSLLKLGPEDRGLAVADVFRFEDGRIAEHWDVIQAMPEATASGRLMV